MNKKLMICNKCSWAHFPISRKDVEEQSRSFGEYIEKETPETQEMFGYGPLSKTKRVWSFKEHVSQSEHCFKCGNTYQNFREENETDNIPMGVTIQGIMVD